jgi:hypothetical protein
LQFQVFQVWSFEAIIPHQVIPCTSGYIIEN